jgi:hypothetical protein
MSYFGIGCKLKNVNSKKWFNYFIIVGWKDHCQLIEYACIFLVYMGIDVFIVPYDYY